MQSDRAVRFFDQSRLWASRFDKYRESDTTTVISYQSNAAPFTKENGAKNKNGYVGIADTAHHYKGPENSLNLCPRRFVEEFADNVLS